jgi:Rieske 2Fe-2S family protein
MTTFEPARVRPGDRSLPARYYLSAAVFEEERRRLFGRQWLCLGRTLSTIPGEYFLAEVDGESLLVVRDDAGRLRAFYNVCRHRGTRLVQTPRGRLTGGIACPYHAWRYRLDGRLATAPHMEEVPDFHPGAYGLHPAAVSEWEGLAWLTLDPRPTPFETVYAPLIGRFAEWNLPALSAVHRIAYDVRANWKLVFENYNECYHCSPLHPRLVQLSPADSGRNDFLEGPFLGGYMTLRPGMHLTASGRACAGRTLGRVAGADLERAYYYTFFPNVLFSLHPHYAMVHTLWPVAADHTRIVCEWFFDPQAPESNPEDAVNFWDEVNRQDWQASEWTQQGMTSRVFSPGPYSQREGLSAAFDRYYLQAMGENG